MAAVYEFLAALANFCQVSFFLIPIFLCISTIVDAILSSLWFGVKRRSCGEKRVTFVVSPTSFCPLNVFCCKLYWTCFFILRVETKNPKMSRARREPWRNKRQSRAAILVTTAQGGGPHLTYFVTNTRLSQRLCQPWENWPWWVCWMFKLFVLFGTLS